VAFNFRPQAMPKLAGMTHFAAPKAAPVPNFAGAGNAVVHAAPMIQPNPEATGQYVMQRQAQLAALKHMMGEAPIGPKPQINANPKVKLPKGQ
jgi:hypothetical protein